MTVKKDTSNHYIDNNEFFVAMSEWKKLWVEAKDSGGQNPPVTEYIGSCFLKIAENLVRRPNFMNYHYRDDMIGDGVENCMLYCYNFDPEKSHNPFSYFTQIIYYAFIRRIQKEKKENYIKYKKLRDMDHDGRFAIGFFNEQEKSYHEQMEDRQAQDDIYADILEIKEDDIKQFKEKENNKKKKKVNKNSTNAANIGELFQED